mgnify:CR=1 FL=1
MLDQLAIYLVAPVPDVHIKDLNGDQGLLADLIEHLQPSAASIATSTFASS